MSRSPLLRTSVFRLAMLATPLFVAAGWLLLGFVYINTVNLMDATTNRAIDQEIQRLEDLFAEFPGRSEADLVVERFEHERGSPRLYQLRDPSGRPIVGNVTLAEPLPAPRGTRAYVDVEVGRRGQPHLPARFRVVARDDGTTLLVGRDLREQTAFRHVVEESLAIAVAITVLLGGLVGALASRAVLRRLHDVNRTARRILHGRLDERVPLSGHADEFDRLAGNLNAMLDRIETLMAAMGEVTANIAHDLRTPLNRLRSTLEVALLRDAPREDCLKAMQSALDEADHLLATFNALLTIARIENAARQPDDVVDLAAMIEDLADVYAPAAEDRGDTLEVAAVEPAAIRGDRHLLFQALSNLVDNALDHTPQGTAVTLSLATGPRGLELAVADDGPGIPAQDRRRVLGRFVRLDASRNTPGTGLGLSLAAAVAVYHAGTLELSDNHPGLRAAMIFPGTEG